MANDDKIIQPNEVLFSTSLFYKWSQHYLTDS